MLQAAVPIAVVTSMRMAAKQLALVLIRAIRPVIRTTTAYSVLRLRLTPAGLRASVRKLTRTTAASAAIPVAILTSQPAIAASADATQIPRAALRGESAMRTRARRTISTATPAAA